MRLRTCLGGLLLGLSACAGFTGAIPGDVRIDVDGSSLVFKKKPEPPAPVPPAPAPEPPAPDAPQG
jgi:hypothetical protein